MELIITTSITKEEKSLIEKDLKLKDTLEGVLARQAEVLKQTWEEKVRKEYFSLLKKPASEMAAEIAATKAPPVDWDKVPGDKPVVIKPVTIKPIL